MFSDPLRKLINPPLEAAAAQFVRWRLDASALTAIGFIAGLAAFVCIATHKPLVGLGFIVLNRVLGEVAWPLARMTGAATFVAYLETVLDFVFRASIPMAFALADPSRALAATFVTLSFVGSGTTLLAFEVFAIARGLPTEGQDARVPHENGGLIERTAIAASFAVACVMPTWFSVIAYILGIGCFVAAGMRVAVAIEKLR